MSARPVPEEEDRTIALFGRTATIGEVQDAADIVEKLGYVPEIRLIENGMELYTKDLPSMVSKLRASLTAGAT